MENELIEKLQLVPDLDDHGLFCYTSALLANTVIYYFGPDGFVEFQVDGDSFYRHEKKLMEMSALEIQLWLSNEIAKY